MKNCVIDLLRDGQQFFHTAACHANGSACGLEELVQQINSHA